MRLVFAELMVLDHKELWQEFKDNKISNEPKYFIWLKRRFISCKYKKIDCKSGCNYLMIKKGYLLGCSWESAYIRKGGAKVSLFMDRVWLTD